MALTKDIRLSILADVADYQKRMATIPGITEKQAGAAARKMEKQLVKAQVDSAKAAQKAATQSARAWSDVGSIIKGQLSADALKAFGAAALDLVSDTMETRQAIIRLSNATGIGRDTLAGMEEAFRSVGADSAEVTEQLQDFNEKLFDFGRGGGAAEEAFAGLGLDMQAVASGAISSDEALRQVLDRLPRMTDATTKAAFAQQLFSDRGLDVTNALENLPLDQAIAQAERFGRTVDAEAVASTKRWTEGLGLLSGAMNGVVVETIDWIQPAQRIDDLLVGLVATSAAVSEGMKLLRNSIRSTSEGLGAFVLGAEQEAIVGVGEAARLAAEDFQRARQEAKGLAQAGVEVAISMDDMAAALGFGSAMTKPLAKDTGDLAKRQRDSAKAAQGQAKALDQLLAAGLAAGDDLLSAEEKVLEARDRDLNKIRELGAAAGEEALAEVFAEERKQQAVRETRALRVAGLGEVVAESRTARETLEQAEADAHEEAKIRVEELRQLRRDALAEQLAGFEQAAGTSLQVAGVLADRRARDAADELADQDDLIASLEARRGELEQAIAEATSKRQRQALRGELRGVRRAEQAEAVAREQAAARSLAAWRGQQQAAAAEATFQGGVAAIKAYALFGPPPSPAGIAASAAALALTAAQVGLISSEKPPQFHTGFSGQGATFPSFSAGPDERSVVVRSTEPVLNQRAGDELGRENIAELNRTGTLPAGGGAGGGIMELNFERRQIGALVGGTVRAGGRLRTLIARVGGAGPAGRRPVFNR